MTDKTVQAIDRLSLQLLQQKRPAPAMTGSQLLDELAERKAIRERYYRSSGELEANQRTLVYYYNQFGRKRYSL